MEPKNNSFQNFLEPITSEIIQKYWIDKNGLLKKDPDFTPNYSKKEKYAVDTLLSLGEIESLYDQLEQAPYFLSSFRQTKTLKEKGISRYDHIIYHIESHLFRTTGILDRMMIHLNIVFKFGLSPLKCKAYNLLLDKKGNLTQHSKIIGEINPKLLLILIKFKEIVDHFRDSRNQITHQSTYRSEILRNVQLYDIAKKIYPLEYPIKRHKHVEKRITDKAVRKYKTDMLEFNSGIRAILDHVYPYLEEIWKEEYAKKD